MIVPHCFLQAQGSGKFNFFLPNSFQKAIQNIRPISLLAVWGSCLRSYTNPFVTKAYYLKSNLDLGQALLLYQLFSNPYKIYKAFNCPLLDVRLIKVGISIALVGFGMVSRWQTARYQN